MVKADGVLIEYIYICSIVVLSFIMKTWILIYLLKYTYFGT